MSASAVAALSLHPMAPAGLGEVTGEVLDALGVSPDLVVLAVSGTHVDSLGSMTDAVGSLLAPRCLLTLGVGGTFAGRTAVAEGPAVVLWAATGLAVTPLSAEVFDALDTEGTDASPLPHDGTLLSVATSGEQLAQVITKLNRHRPALPLVGGVVAAPRGTPGAPRLGLNGRLDGSPVGLHFPEGAASAATAGAVRPVGDPLVVTDAVGQVVAGLAGAPAADRLDAMIGGLTPEVRQALRSGVFLCRVTDERALDPGPSEVVSHGIRGVVARTRSLALDAVVEVGTLVRFGYLDAATADGEVRRSVLGASTAAGGRAAGALLFGCGARGSSLFADPSHDVRAVADTLGTTAVAGVHCDGEVTTRGGRSWLCGYSASTLVIHAEGPQPLG